MINGIGCEKKYESFNQNLDNLTCSKDMIVTAWEKSFNTTSVNNGIVYGCLDKKCCFETYSYIKSKINYNLIILFPLFLLSCLIFCGNWYIYIEKNNVSEEDNNSSSETDWSGGMVVLVVFVIAVVLIGFIPIPPTSDPIDKIKVDKAPANHTEVNVDLVQPNLIEIISNENKEKKKQLVSSNFIKEDKTKCGENCPRIKFTYELSSNDGVFERVVKNSENILTNTPINEKASKVIFFSDSIYLQNFTDYYQFIPNCPLYSANISVIVKGFVYDSKNSIRDSSFQSFLLLKSKNLLGGENKNLTILNNQLANYQIPVIDYSKLKIGQNFQIINKNVEYSFVNKNKYQIISGRVLYADLLNNIQPVFQSSVELTSVDFPNCKIQKYNTDENGNFYTDKLYALNNNVPTKYTLDIIKNGFQPLHLSVVVGGIGLLKQKHLGDMILNYADSVKTNNIISSVYNSLNNQILENVKVSLWTGFLNFNKKKDSETNSYLSLLQIGADQNIRRNRKLKSYSLSEINLKASVMTDSNGTFVFSELTSGIYTITLEKEGFYREVQRKY